MNIFELVKNDKFFNLLSSPNRKLYYDCIIILIEKSKEVPVLYDIDARNIIALYLKNSGYEYIDEYDDTTISVEAPERNASDIMMRFRECGWVTPREIGRNGENVANVSTTCWRIIEFLRKMCEKSNDGALSNRIFSMYEILKASFDDDSARAERPYSNILMPLVEHQTELRNELLYLKDNIANIMRTVMEIQDVNSFGKFLIKDELLDRFFGDYFFIKNNGLIPSQIAYIKSKLSMIQHGEMLDKMVTECGVQLNLDNSAAKDKVEAYLSGLQYFLAVEYEENMELIDTRINIYYNLANTRMMLVMSNGLNLESKLDSFLNKIKTLTDDDRQTALDKISDCMQIRSQEYISKKSYEKKVKKKKNTSAIDLNANKVSEEELEKRTKELLDTGNRFSVKNVDNFIENRLKQNSEIKMDEQSVTSREEAIMFAASVMYSGIEDFPYEVELKEGFTETEVAIISNMAIRKKMRS